VKSLKTFVIFKPDTIQRRLVGEILARFERAGMFILRIERRQMDFDWFDLHYSHIIDKLTPSKLTEMRNFMTSTSMIGVILAGDPGKVKRMVGATDSLAAAPGTIRGDYARSSGCYNLIHAADNAVIAKAEARLFFGD